MSQVPENAITTDGSGCRISCLVVPRASRNALIAWHDNRLKVALAAPPVDGEANKALVKFMAEVLNVSKTSISVSSGLTGRRKVIAVSGLDSTTAAKILNKLVKD
ncbi:MAG: DUF167 domain-containing protein [Lentisphaerae bacterium]|nr:DUF167 domain-containing protein [Lentisphaerota bacterium]